MVLALFDYVDTIWSKQFHKEAIYYKINKLMLQSSVLGIGKRHYLPSNATHASTCRSKIVLYPYGSTIVDDAVLILVCKRVWLRQVFELSNTFLFGSETVTNSQLKSECWFTAK